MMSLCLSACSKPAEDITNFEKAQAALQTLNTPLINVSKESEASLNTVPPLFSDNYLDRRHEIYQRLMQMDLSVEQTEQVNYLVIAERFPERYFSWPAQVNVLENMLKHETENQTEQVKLWLSLTLNRLKNAQESNLKLNKIELNLLKGYLNNHLNSGQVKPSLAPEINEFSLYLSQYQPRGTVGLSGLANGSAWYQSKINYYSAVVYSPLQWVDILNKKITALSVKSPPAIANMSHDVSFVVRYLAKEKTEQGLDWATNYQLIPLIAKRKILSEDEQVLMLALMESDIGIHYHAWSIAQARVNLIKHLAITQQQAQYLVEDIILYPGHSFSFAQNILFTH